MFNRQIRFKNNNFLYGFSNAAYIFFIFQLSIFELLDFWIILFLDFAISHFCIFELLDYRIILLLDFIISHSLHFWVLDWSDLRNCTLKFYQFVILYFIFSTCIQKFLPRSLPRFVHTHSGWLPSACHKDLFTLGMFDDGVMSW